MNLFLILVQVSACLALYSRIAIVPSAAFTTSLVPAYNGISLDRCNTICVTQMNAPCFDYGLNGCECSSSCNPVDIVTGFQSQNCYQSDITAGPSQIALLNIIGFNMALANAVPVVLNAGQSWYDCNTACGQLGYNYLDYGSGLCHCSNSQNQVPNTATDVYFVQLSYVSLQPLLASSCLLTHMVNPTVWWANYDVNNCNAACIRLQLPFYDFGDLGCHCSYSNSHGNVVGTT